MRQSCAVSSAHCQEVNFSNIYDRKKFLVDTTFLWLKSITWNMRQQWLILYLHTFLWHFHLTDKSICYRCLPYTRITGLILLLLFVSQHVAADANTLERRLSSQHRFLRACIMKFLVVNHCKFAISRWHLDARSIYWHVVRCNTPSDSLTCRFCKYQCNLNTQSVTRGVHAVQLWGDDVWRAYKMYARLYGLYGDAWGTDRVGCAAWRGVHGWVR